MKAKLKVLVPFTDKNDRTVHYKEGDTVSFDDIERVNDLVARKICRLVFIEDDVPAATTADGIVIGDKSYPLAAVKVALEAIGVTVSKNAGIPPSARPSRADRRRACEAGGDPDRIGGVTGHSV